MDSSADSKECSCPTLGDLDPWKCGFTSSSITVTTTLVSLFLVENDLIAVAAAALATTLGNSLSDGISVGTSNKGAIDFEDTGDIVWKVFVAEVSIGLPLSVVFAWMAHLQQGKKVPAAFRIPEKLSWRFKLVVVVCILVYVAMFIAAGSFIEFHESWVDILTRIGLIYGVIIVVSSIIYGANAALRGIYTKK